ncbi:hypothetical protein [Paenibacillus sp. 1-18]|uniref:hypothetical protein n=1 Tax=Paenibacillus sp. 1-18 TaxID=1333846 RepID=UPI00046F22E0
MVKLNKKFVVTILILFFLISVSTLFTNSESQGLIYGILSYLLFLYNSKITKYDYIFMGSLVLGVILEFITIFYKNTELINLYSVFISGLALFIYFKKGKNHE